MDTIFDTQTPNAYLQPNFQFNSCCELFGNLVLRKLFSHKDIFIPMTKYIPVAIVRLQYSTS